MRIGRGAFRPPWVVERLSTRLNMHLASDAVWLREGGVFVFLRLMVGRRNAHYPDARHRGAAVAGRSGGRALSVEALLASNVLACAGARSGQAQQPLQRPVLNASVFEGRIGGLGIV